MDVICFVTVQLLYMFNLLLTFSVDYIIMYKV